MRAKYFFCTNFCTCFKLKNISHSSHFKTRGEYGFQTRAIWLFKKADLYDVALPQTKLKIANEYSPKRKYFRTGGIIFSINIRKIFITHSLQFM